VRRNQITDRGLGYLTELSTLRSLSLKATRVTDDGLLQHIVQLSELQGLSLAYLDISDASLLALESITWLERINLTHTAITNDGIVNFVCGKAHTLRELNLSNTAISDVALAQCLPNSNLSNLSLIDTGITDAACKECADCEWLTDLRLDLTDITDDGVRNLTNCVHLQRLELFRTRVTDACLVWLSDTRVEHLGLGHTSVTDAGIPALTDFPALQSLDLQRTLLTDRGLRYLGAVASLSRLHLEHTKISNAGVEFLLDLPLESLSLNPKIDNAGLNTLSNHKSLRRLAIWNCTVTGWQPLKNLDRLQVLLIDDSVTDLSPLRSLNQLEVLILWGDQFSPTELARLRLSLPKCRIKTFAACERAMDEFRSLCGGS
jgi:Leucine-rich repeat (LRR) protein